MKIYTIQGQMLQEHLMPMSSFSIADYSDGLYFYQLENKKGQVVKYGKLLLRR